MIVDILQNLEIKNKYPTFNINIIQAVINVLGLGIYFLNMLCVKFELWVEIITTVNISQE